MHRQFKLIERILGEWLPGQINENLQVGLAKLGQTKVVQFLKTVHPFPYQHRIERGRERLRAGAEYHLGKTPDEPAI